MPERDGQEALPVSLVWIDSQTAVHLRWDGAVSLQRIHSEVPPHHHAMGHLRIDPLTRHGGGGPGIPGIGGGGIPGIPHF